MALTQDQIDQAERLHGAVAWVYPDLSNAEFWDNYFNQTEPRLTPEEQASGISIGPAPTGYQSSLIKSLRDQSGFDSNNPGVNLIPNYSTNYDSSASLTNGSESTNQSAPNVIFDPQVFSYQPGVVENVKMKAATTSSNQPAASKYLYDVPSGESAEYGTPTAANSLSPSASIAIADALQGYSNLAIAPGSFIAGMISDSIYNSTVDPSTGMIGGGKGSQSNSYGDAAAGSDSSMSGYSADIGAGPGSGGYGGYGGDGGYWAKGGMVSKDRLIGPNPPGPDDGFGGLQHGEFVLTADAVKKLGPAGIEVLRRLNAKDNK